MVKKPSLQASANRTSITDEQSEALAQRLADKPYGATEKQEPAKPEQELQCRTTISLGESMLRKTEDRALKNKRSGKDPKNVSAIVREALDLYFEKNP
ncbi:hypothetical protein D3C80_1158180 [compost metagenome]